MEDCFSKKYLERKQEADYRHTEDSFMYAFVPFVIFIFFNRSTIPAQPQKFINS